MAVAIDAARQHVQAARVDLVVAGRQVLSQRDDLAGLDADVADHRIGGGDDGAAADDEIEFGHRRPPVPAASPTRRRLNFAATRDNYSPSRRRVASKFGRLPILGISLDVGLPATTRVRGHAN